MARPASGFKISGVRMPGFKTPGFKMPRFKMPGFKTPRFKMPGFRLGQRPRLPPGILPLRKITLIPGA
jgi:hypothetical protein